jgi:general secretion pathway protein D
MRLSLSMTNETRTMRVAAAAATLLLISYAAPPSASAQPPAPSAQPAQPAPPAQPRGAGRTGRQPGQTGVPRTGPNGATRPGTTRPTWQRTTPAARPGGAGAAAQAGPGATGTGTDPAAAPATPGAPGTPGQPPRAGRSGATTGRGSSATPGNVGRNTNGTGTTVPEGETLNDESLYACDKAKGRFKVNLAPDIELKDLVTWAFSFTCKNFIYSSAIGTRAAKVTIKSPESMTARQAWSVFLVALQSMGLTVVPKGNVLEIVEYAQAKTAPLPIYTRGRPANSDQMVRAILRPEHLPVDDVAAILTEIKSASGSVKGLPRAGVVVVTDFGTHISKMSQLLLSVDQPVFGEKLYMMRVKYADASEMAQTLSEILGTKDSTQQPPGAPPMPRQNNVRRPIRGPQNQPEQAAPEPAGSSSDSDVESAVPSKVLADARTNALIMLASEPAYLRVKALVNRLDVSIDVEGAGRIHVYPLEHADAEETATTLTSVISGIQQPPSGGGQGGGGREGQPGNRPQRAPEPQQQRSVATSDSAAAFEGVVRVTHDKPTNSLVIVASVKDFLAVREVLKKLDVPRPQVYIEASIVEIGIDNSRDLGASWHAGKEVGDGDLIIGGVQHGNLSSLNVASVASATGLIGGALGHILPGAQELLGTSIPSFGILFQALANTSNLDVLSSPHILTTDNEEAEISVGQNIPYQSALVGLPGGAGNTGGAAGTFFPTQSIQRQDVELNLKLTPQINASGEVKLKIDLTINDIASQDFAGLGPSWSKKTLKDVVVVRDQQPVVLGGLISDKTTNTESKVPLLGDIPILGYLFKFSSKQKQKRNLLIVLTPYIVHSHTDLERIVERRVREQREFMRTFSTFRDITYRPDVDYGRKGGLLSEINRLVYEQERNAKVLEELEEKDVGFPDGPVEYLDAKPTGTEPPSGPDDDKGDGADRKEGAGAGIETENAIDGDDDAAKAQAKADAKIEIGPARKPAAGAKKKSLKGKRLKKGKARAASAGPATGAGAAAKPAGTGAAAKPATTGAAGNGAAGNGAAGNGAAGNGAGAAGNGAAGNGAAGTGAGASRDRTAGAAARTADRAAAKEK